MSVCRFRPYSRQGVGELFAARRSGCCTKSGRLPHAKTIRVGASPPRNLVNYPAVPSVFAPLRVLCGNSAVHSARAPPRLVRGGRNAELVEFTHLLRSTNFIMRHWGVNRSGRAEATATPRAQSALGRRTGSPSARPGGGPIVWAHGIFALKYFVIDAAESRSRCRGTG